MNVIEKINLTDWTQYKDSRLEYYCPEKVVDSLKKLYNLTEEKNNKDTYDFVLSSIGNNHCGTYYPAIKSALPIIIEIAQQGLSEISRNCALEILSDLYYSFVAEIESDDKNCLQEQELEEFVRNNIEDFFYREVLPTESNRNKKLITEFLEFKTEEQLLSSLPKGWFVSDYEKAIQLHQELQKELPNGHILYKKAVAVLAHREGTDDILCHHKDDKTRFTVIHLTWSGKEEVEGCPYVECDGSFNDFLEYENRF